MNNLATTLFCLLAGAGSALAQASGQAPAQAPAQADVIFRSDVMLVRVDAQVRDRSNRAIAGLRAEDFVLREQGRVREIRNFAREEMAMDVLLLLDVSGSMRTHVERIASAAHSAFQSLGPDDRVAIMVFDRQTRVQMPFKAHRTGDVERGLDKVLDRESFNGGTDHTRYLQCHRLCAAERASRGPSGDRHSDRRSDGAQQRRDGIDPHALAP